MGNIENPQIQIIIYTGYGQLVYGSDDIEVQISKDMEEEPNEAKIKIHNLNEDHRQEIIDYGKESAPVEVYLTQWGSTNLVRCFTGEIDRAKTVDLYPDAGVYTEIRATSQKINHRAFYITEKAFAKGTPYAFIITYLAQQIGLPTMFGQLPIGVTLYSYSMSGPAFKLLKAYLYDFGYYAYINNGVLYITDAYSPVNPVPKILDQNLLFNPPEANIRSDGELAEIATVRMNNVGDVIKQVHNVNLQGPSTYLPASVQDDQIEGRIYTFPVFPDVEPDDVLLVGTETTRAYSVDIDCDNMNDRSMWQMTIEADLVTGPL